MPGLNINDIISVSARGTCFDQRIILTLWYRVATTSSASTTQQDLQQLAEFLAPPATPAGLMDAYLACLPQEYVMREIRTQRVYPVRTAFQSTPLSIVGQFDGGTAYTANVAAALTLKTAKAGRSQISTKHVGPIPTDNTGSGQVNASLLAAVGNFGVKARGVLVVPDSCTYQPIIYHRNGDGPAAKYDDIISSKAESTVRVMRRRTVGLGE